MHPENNLPFLEFSEKTQQLLNKIIENQSETHAFVLQALKFIEESMNMIGKVDGKVQSLLPEKRPIGRPRKHEKVRAIFNGWDVNSLMEAIKCLKLGRGKWYKILDLITLMLGNTSLMPEEEFTTLKAHYSIKRVAMALSRLKFTKRKTSSGFLWSPPESFFT